MKMLVLTARIAASRFVPRWKAQAGRDAWRPISLHWRKTRRRLETPRNRREAMAASTNVWQPQFHLHFATLSPREPFSPRGFLRGEKVPKADEGGVNAIPAIFRRAEMKYACNAPSSAYRHPSTRFARSGQALLPRQNPRGRKTLEITGRRSFHLGSEKSGLTRTSVVEPIRKGVRAGASRNAPIHFFRTHAPTGRGELLVSRRSIILRDATRTIRTSSQQVIVRPPELVYRRELTPRTEVADQPSRPIPATSHRPSSRSVAIQETAPEASISKRPPALRLTDLDPALLDRLTDDVIRRVDRRVRIERERRGL